MCLFQVPYVQRRCQEMFSKDPVKTVVKDRRLSIYKEAKVCIVYLSGPYPGNVNAFE